MLATLSIAQRYNGAFTCQQIRDLVKAKGHYLMAGMSPQHPTVVNLRQQRDAYIEKVGLPTYLSQMLDDIAQVPIGKCILGWEDGRVMEFAGQAAPVQRHIRQYFARDLPFVVEANWCGRVEAKFL